MSWYDLSASRALPLQLSHSRFAPPACAHRPPRVHSWHRAQALLEGLRVVNSQLLPLGCGTSRRVRSGSGGGPSGAAQQSAAKMGRRAAS